MDLDLTSEQRMLKESAERFFSRECPYSRVKEIEESPEGYSPELWAKMAELGWLGLYLPEQYGGFGASFTDLVILLEEMGRAAFPSPYFSTVIQCASVLLLGGTEGQKETLLPRISEGDLIMSLSQYEQEVSYLSTGIRMEARPHGDRFVLNGRKLFCLDANIAQKLIVAARIPQEGVTLFLVDAKTPGISCQKMPTIAMDNSCEVTFRDVMVDAGQVIGAPGQGWELLEVVNQRAAVAKCAEMVGGCRFCIDTTAEYAKQREQYGQPIALFQVIQHYMANMLLAYDTAFNYLYRVASLIDEGRDVALEASVLKACVNENFKFIAERAVQIHGAIGTSREGNVGLFYRRAKAYEYQCGDTDFHLERVMGHLENRGVPPL